MHVANLTFLSRAKRSTCGLPQRWKTLSTMVWSRLHSVFRIWYFLDRWSTNTFKCPGMCLGTNVFPDFQPRGICLLLDHSIGGILPPPPPPDISGRQQQTCCRTWEQVALSKLWQKACRPSQTAQSSRTLMCRWDSLSVYVLAADTFCMWAPHPWVLLTEQVVLHI